MAKMRGHIGVGGRCWVENHRSCELARECQEDRIERAREKREWRLEWFREDWAHKVHDWDAPLA